MKRILLFLIVFAALLLSCVTTYKPEGFGGGYTDLPLGGNRFRIDVRGNGYTGMQRVRDIAMVRAAELAQSNGYKYFFIVDSGSDKDVRVGSYQGQIYSVRNNYASLLIELTNDQTGLDAERILRELGPEVGYDQTSYY